MHIILGIVPFEGPVLVHHTHLVNHQAEENITLGSCHFPFCSVSFDGFYLVRRNKLNK